MPIQLSTLSLLADPFYAFLWAFLYVGFLAYVFYRIPANWQKPRLDLYLRGIGLASELLVAVGLVGIVTFVGRTYLENVESDAKAATRLAEVDLSQKFANLAFSYCFVGSQPHSRQVSASRRDACVVWHNYSGLYRDDLDWMAAKRELDSIGETAQTDKSFAALLKAISQSIDSMIAARHQRALVPLEKDILAERHAWPLILMFAFLAGTGVSLKCARSAREFRSELARVGRDSKKDRSPARRAKPRR